MVENLSGFRKRKRNRLRKGKAVRKDNSTMDQACYVCEKKIAKQRAEIRVSLLANLKDGSQKWYYNDRPIHVRCLDRIRAFIKEDRTRNQEST